MRGFHVAKKVAVYLNDNVMVKRLAILYLLFCIASHLITPTNAHYTYKENVTGEMSVSDQLGQADETENDAEQPVQEEKKIDKENEQKEDKPKSNESEEATDKNEEKQEPDQTEKQVDNDVASQDEKESNEPQSGEQNSGGSDQTDANSEAEEQEELENAP